MKTKRHLLITLITSLTLIACQPSSQTDAPQDTPTAQPSNPTASKQNPKSDEAKEHVSSEINRIQAELAKTPKIPDNTTADQYQPKIDYQAYPEKQQQTFYFDQNGKNIPKKIPNGFIRKVLGETKDGLLVVQDFYANGKPQIAPSLTKQGANLKDFNADQSEGWVVWFDQQGKIEQTVNLQFGKPQGYTAYYVNGKRLGFAQIPNQSRIEVVMLYPNGNLKGWVKYNFVTNEKEIAALYENGEPAIFALKKNQEYQNLAAWQKNGDLLPSNQYMPPEILTLDQEIDTLMQHLFKDEPHESDKQSQDKSQNQSKKQEKKQ